MEPVRDQIFYSKKIVLRFLDLVIGAIETLLALRIVLRVLGANPDTNFVAWLYATTDQLLIPFWNIFPSPALFGRYVVEFPTLFAMLAYAFFGWALVRLISIVIETIFPIDRRT